MARHWALHHRPGRAHDEGRLARLGLTWPRGHLQLPGAGDSVLGLALQCLGRATGLRAHHCPGLARLGLGHTTEDDLARLARLAGLTRLHVLGGLQHQLALLVKGCKLGEGGVLTTWHLELGLQHLELRLKQKISLTFYNFYMRATMYL